MSACCYLCLSFEQIVVVDYWHIDLSYLFLCNLEVLSDKSELEFVMLWVYYYYIIEKSYDFMDMTYYSVRNLPYPFYFIDFVLEYHKLMD
jgi:hypothetical protein